MYVGMCILDRGHIFYTHLLMNRLIQKIDQILELYRGQNDLIVILQADGPQLEARLTNPMLSHPL